MRVVVWVDFMIMPVLRCLSCFVFDLSRHGVGTISVVWPQTRFPSLSLFTAAGADVKRFHSGWAIPRNRDMINTPEGTYARGLWV